MSIAVKIEYMIRQFNETVGRVIHNPDLLQAASGVGHTGPHSVGLTDAMKSIGQTYFDTTNKVFYDATGVSAVTDWKARTNA